MKVQILKKDQVVSTENFGTGVVVEPDGGDMMPDCALVLFDDAKGKVNPRWLPVRVLRY